MRLLGSIGLRGRITVLVGLTVAAAIGVSVYVGIAGLDETQDAAEREQLTSTARAVADHVDDVLARTAGREEHMARMVANARSRGEPELMTLLDSYPSLLFESDLYLLRPPGELVWSMRPGVSVTRSVFGEPLVRASLESGQSTVGPCSASTTQDRSRACFASPILLEDGDPADVLLAQIDLTRPDLNLFSLERLDQAVRIELVAPDGVVVAASQPSAGETSVHADALAAQPSQERSGDAIHHQLAEDEESSHRFGYASISMIPGWGVVVEPKDTPALAVTGDAQQRLLLFALAALPASLALAWLGARQVLKPLHALTYRAGVMAAGDLSTAVVAAQRDEVGELAEVLERLRVSLNTTIADAHSLGATRGHLLDGLFARQEEERQRIAHELHEQALQSLAALALTLDSLKDELASAGQAVLERVAGVRTQALALVQDLRRLAVDLRPPTLNDLGLGPTLRSYAESRLSEMGIRNRFDSSNMETRPSPLHEISLYRVAQEAIDNIAIHAEARTVGITLRCAGRLLTLVVEDDGKGFEPAEVLADPDAARGLGILSMQERISLVGGTFSVESAPGQGTRVRAEIPLERGQQP